MRIKAEPAPKGQTWCYHHHRNEPVSNFYPSKSTKTGLDARCKEGSNEARRDLRKRKRDNLQRSKELGLV